MMNTPPQPPYATSPRPRAHTYADPAASAAAPHQSPDPYRRNPPAAAGSHPLPGPRHMSATHAESAGVRPYPPPPPPLQTNPHATTNLPPPPPRLNLQQQHPGMTIPPPPPQGFAWGQQQSAYPLPPMSLNREPRAYDPVAYTTHKTMTPMPSFPNMPPPDQPLTSATYIPGGESFGPGVGIPPLHSPTQQPRTQPFFSQPLNNWYVQPDEYASHSTLNAPSSVSTNPGPTSGWHSDASTYYTYDMYQQNQHQPAPPTSQPNYSSNLAPNNYNVQSHVSSNHLPSLQHSSSIRHAQPPTPSSKKSIMVLPAKETQEYTSPGPQRTASFLDSNPHARDGRNSAEAPPSPHDAAWPIERVVSWLALNGFSQIWQSAFRALNLEGSHFLEVGRSAKTTVSTFHSTIYPQIAKECERAGIQLDKTHVMAEGRRARKLIRGIIEGGAASVNGNTSSSSRHQRQGSVNIPSAGTDDGSPHLGNATPDTTNSGEGSPGMRMPAGFPTGTNATATTEWRRNTPKTGLGALTNLVGKDFDASNGRSMQNAIREANGGPRRSSPANGDILRDGLTRGPSPRHSPALRGVKPHESSLQGLSGDRSSSTETNLVPFNVPGQSKSAASEHNADRASSEGHRSRSSNDMRSPALHHRTLRKDQHLDELVPSPTSPMDLPLSALAPQSGRSWAGKTKSVAERQFVFATPDGWNYRLIDLSDADTPEGMRRIICFNLGIADHVSVTFHITSPGQLSHDEALSDSMLLSARTRQADPLASLKLFVNTGSQNEAAATAALTGGFPTSPFNHTTTLSAPPAKDGTFKRATDSQFDEQLNVPRPRASSGYLGSTELKSRESVSRPLNERINLVERKAEEYRREMERKQRAYQEQRLKHIKKDAAHNAQHPNDPSIRRDRIIDFDMPRQSPYENRTGHFSDLRSDQKPMRSAPKAPPQPSDTARRVSIRRQPSSGTDGGKEEPKTTSSDKAKLPATTRENNLKKTEQRAETLLERRPKALALVGFGSNISSHSNNSSGGSRSPRSPITMSPSGQPFLIPDYTTDNQDNNDFHEAINERPHMDIKMPAGSEGAATAEKTSPSVSPSTAHPGSSQNQLFRRGTRKSYVNGPSFEIPKQEVKFKNDQTTDLAEEDDSDEDLFQVPIASRQPNANSGVSSGKTSTKGHSPAGFSEAKRDFSPGNGGKGDGDIRVEFHPASAGPSASTSSPAGFNKPNRRESFASDLWANRPPPEAVVEHLDDFFPNVDLDQLLVDDSQGAANAHDSPPQNNFLDTIDRANSSWIDFSNSSRTNLPELNENGTLGSEESTLKGKDYFQNVASRSLRKQGVPGRTRSIRDVVKGAYSMSSKNSQVSTSSFGSERAMSGYFGQALPNRISALKPESGLHRRKSTKMFGAKIEQITPSRGSRVIQLETIPQDTLPTPSTTSTSRDEPQRQPTFRWMRGELIGKGTFGRVYLGMNTTTGELIAVKQVEVNHKAPNADPKKIRDMVKALDSEIDTMQHLDHVNIVQYLGCERKEYSISIFLEYISGGSIVSVLRKHGKFEESVVSSLTRQTLSGLAYLHREGILHRDLKADNILLTTDGICKISDFGISKKSRNPYNNDVSNSMQGSVFWMAPEVIRAQSQSGADVDASNQGYSAKVDIWSLGCVVLEMFAGHRPWSKEEVVGAIFKLGLKQAPPIPDDVSSVVGPAALSFMYDCFTIDPADRPTAETLLRAPFCFSDPHYNFYDTELYAKIRPGF